MNAGPTATADYYQAIAILERALEDAVDRLIHKRPPNEENFYRKRIASCERAIALLKAHNNPHPPEA